MNINYSTAVQIFLSHISSRHEIILSLCADLLLALDFNGNYSSAKMCACMCCMKPSEKTQKSIKRDPLNI